MVHDIYVCTSDVPDGEFNMYRIDINKPIVEIKLWSDQEPKHIPQEHSAPPPSNPLKTSRPTLGRDLDTSSRLLPALRRRPVQATSVRISKTRLSHRVTSSPSPLHPLASYVECKPSWD